MSKSTQEEILFALYCIAGAATTQVGYKALAVYLWVSAAISGVAALYYAYKENFK